MNEKQRRRCEIITRLIANKISSSEASELLDRSCRQVRTDAGITKHVWTLKDLLVAATGV